MDFSLFCSNTEFENHRKSLIQHCERSELRLYDLYFEWIKREAIFGQTVLPDGQF